LLLRTGFWPDGVEFDTRDLATVMDVAEKQAKRR